MKKVAAAPAPEPRAELARIAAWVYDAFLTIKAIGQLFAFEKFLPLMDSYWLPGGHGTGTLVAGLLAMAEVLAVPFLLRMPLSRLMRYFSMGCSVFVPVVWILLTSYALAKHYALSNGGMFGTAVKVPLGLQLVVAIVLLVLALFVIYGLSPKQKR
jgi:hypothetical protein